jgi:hypothetical protein
MESSIDLEAEIKRGKERHLSKQYSFCGPGTKLQNRLKGTYEKNMKKYKKPLVGKAPYNKPLNILDAACKRHDIAFSKPDLSAKQVREADRALIAAAKSIQNNTRNPRPLRKDARKVRYGIRGKVLLEDVGILRKGSFAQGGDKESKLKTKAKQVVKKKAIEFGKKKLKDIIAGGIKRAVISGVKGQMK